MKKAAFFALLMLSTAGIGMAQSTTASTNPVGFVTVNVPAQADYALGTPLQQPAVYQGQIQSISGSQIVVAGTPGWTASQFVFVSGTQNVTYYAQIDSGTAEGLYALVSANDSGSVTITLNSGDSLSGVLTNATNAGGGDFISIIPYWTPSTLFSGATAGIQLLFFNQTGINGSASPIYGFNGTDWKKGLTTVDNTPISPLQGMVLRNNNATAVSLSMTGAVPMAAHRQLFTIAQGVTQQDIWFYFNSPVPEVIGNVNLGITLTAGDQLFGFDHTTPNQQNKSASPIIGWNGSIWRQGLTNVTNTFTLQPGWSYVLRKSNPSGNATTYVWTGLQSYLSATPTP